MISSLKLTMKFNAERLREDLVKFSADEWTPHFNQQYYHGDWSGIPLRAPKNAHVALYPDPSADTFVDTENLDRCPYIKSVLDEFKCNLETARFLRLTAGSEIREHKDPGLRVEQGSTRLHIPVVTHPAVEFYLDDRRLEMLPGEVWYLNLSLRHRAKNNSDIDRVHLVVDCVVNEWFTAVFRESGGTIDLSGEDQYAARSLYPLGR